MKKRAIKEYKIECIYIIPASKGTIMSSIESSIQIRSKSRIPESGRTSCLLQLLRMEQMATRLPFSRVLRRAGMKSLSPVTITAISYAFGTVAINSISTARLMSTHFSACPAVTN